MFKGKEAAGCIVNDQVVVIFILIPRRYLKN